jgi:hypothetical protein
MPAAQIKVGRFTVTALSDGYADMPFSYFPVARRKRSSRPRRAFAAKPSGIRFVFNQYLMRMASAASDRHGAGGHPRQVGAAADALRSIGVHRTASAP